MATTAPGRPLALVTGGCRRIGAAIAARLARAGHDLALHSSRSGEVEPGLAVAIAAAGIDHAVFEVDFERDGAAAELMAMVEARFGRMPTLLVNNAAIFGDDRLDSVTEAALSAHMSVNLAAPLMLIQAMAGMSGDAVRSVVNILDQRIAHPHVDQLAYTLSKLALAGVTGIAAQSPGIRINAVAPGLTIPTADYMPDQIGRLAEMMPLRRLPTPEQIADAVHFLALTPATNGQVLYVDGGAHLVPFQRDFVRLAA